ncbi:helix-turn-helix transcriptional regulator [Pseudoalteromonas xiamenensis]|uniref:helix-turn-helix transcriptional regulator n=1 Tax=Pseudoalteromonas xiamenensis TaxID=882626 RepID=UPI0035F004AC
MHKSERLFQLVNYLRSRRLAVSADTLAQAFNVSVRTIYRDIQDLQSSGVSIVGEPGVGYMLSNADLPPLMFTLPELQTLLLGSKMVSQWTDPLFCEHAASALRKIEAVIPAPMKQALDDFPIMVARFGFDEQSKASIQIVRQAIELKQRVLLTYCDAKNESSQREIEPLGMVFWGGKWTLLAFCCLRNDYREFRIDRMQNAQLLEQSFVTTSTKSMNHYVELVRARYRDECQN